MFGDGFGWRAYSEGVSCHRLSSQLATMAWGSILRQCQRSLDTKYTWAEKENDVYFRLTCYKSFIPLEVKDSSLRLYICHHERGREGKEMLLTMAEN